MLKNQLKFLFAGGGTGGHLFPAIAVAEKIRSLLPDADILFIGTKTKIEGRVVPSLGFNFKPIWIKGFSRNSVIKNILFPLKLIVSLIQSLLINIRFRPMVAIGTGGYVAGPAIWSASLTGAKIILIEQNSYPGITTKMLQNFAEEIHLSYEESKKYFRNQNILYVTGNPVRENLVKGNKSEAISKFGMNSDTKTILILGGSLGASKINSIVADNLEKLRNRNVQLIWQTGKEYFDQYKHLASDKVWIAAFIENMNDAYSACDFAVSRAGATSISEILFLGVPSILVPSPNVAENHQYLNAKYLADNGAAVLIEDKNLDRELISKMELLLSSESQLETMSRRAKQLSRPDATLIIAKKAIAYAKKELVN